MKLRTNISVNLATGIILISVSLVSGFAGYKTGKSIHHKKQHNNSVSVVSSNSSEGHDLINPISEIMKKRGLQMTEIKSFRSEIEKSIRKHMRNNPQLRISYYFRDMNNGMWIGVGEKEFFSPASLMKVPCMIAILKEADVSPDILSKKLIYHAADFDGFEEEAGFKKMEGQEYTIEELLLQSIGYSDNAATSMLLRFIGIEKISKVENDLNLHIEKNFTPFTDFVSVKNYADILRVIYNGSYLSESMSEKALELLLTSNYSKGLRAALPEQIKLAHKYGDRDSVARDGKRYTMQLHEFGMVYLPGKNFLIGVMTKGIGSREEKEEIVRELCSITYNSVSSQINSDKGDSNKSWLRQL